MAVASIVTSTKRSNGCKHSRKLGVGGIAEQETCSRPARGLYFEKWSRIA